MKLKKLTIEELGYQYNRLLLRFERSHAIYWKMHSVLEKFIETFGPESVCVDFLGDEMYSAEEENINDRNKLSLVFEEFRRRGYEPDINLKMKLENSAPFINKATMRQLYSAKEEG